MGGINDGSIQPPWGRRINLYCFLCPDIDPRTNQAFCPQAPGFASTPGSAFPVHCWVTLGGATKCECDRFRVKKTCWHTDWLNKLIKDGRVEKPWFPIDLKECPRVERVCLAQIPNFVSLADPGKNLDWGKRVVCALIENQADAVTEFFCSCLPKGWKPTDEEDDPPCPHYKLYKELSSVSLSQQPSLIPGVCIAPGATLPVPLREKLDVCSKCKAQLGSGGLLDVICSQSLDVCIM